jgi:inner membrane protein
MDSLTQIVLGAAVGEAVLGKKVGNKAMLYGAIAGTIPDLDTFASLFTDTITAIEVHRGFSHSIVFAILFAPVFGWLISKIERKSIATWQNWSWLMFWGLVTHPLLDAHTTWGTQLLWPLEVRLAYKNIFVIDPLKDWQTFNSKMPWKSRRSPTWIIKPSPAPFNTILWTANVETEDSFLIGDYSFFDTQPIQFNRFSKNHQLLGDLKDEDKVQRLIKIAEGWYIISEKNGEVYFHDLRFGVLDATADDPNFVFTYKLIPREDGLAVEEVDRDTEEAKKLISVLGDRIFGN